MVQKSRCTSKFQKSDNVHIGQRCSGGSALQAMADSPCPSISCCLSKDVKSGRATGWHFNAFLNANGDKLATICLNSRCQCGQNWTGPAFAIKYLMTKERPASMGYVELHFTVRCSRLCGASNSQNSVAWYSVRADSEAFLQSSGRLKIWISV